VAFFFLSVLTPYTLFFPSPFSPFSLSLSLSLCIPLFCPLSTQGTLRRKGESYDIVWDAPAEVSTAHNEAGRGCELSELVKFQDNLYTFDDRSGIMFQVMNPARSDAAEAPFLVPRNIFLEGSGDINDKGLKIEWATVKDSTLVVGSFGKEYTNSKGEIVHSNNLWSVVVKPDGTKAHVNWKPHYDAMRATLGYTSPGYFIHEAVVWSPHHRKWFVFPRRASKEAYDDVADEKRGSNMIIMASHDFKEVVSTTVGVSAWGSPFFFFSARPCFGCLCAPVVVVVVHSTLFYTRNPLPSHKSVHAHTRARAHLLPSFFFIFHPPDYHP
jgi:hypothetical protein